MIPHRKAVGLGRFHRRSDTPVQGRDGNPLIPAVGDVVNEWMVVSPAWSAAEQSLWVWLVLVSESVDADLTGVNGAAR